MGEAPVLEHRGTRLAQSGVILDYIAGKFGRFGPNDDDERREFLRWLLWDNHKLTGYTATLRFMRALAKDPDPAVVAEFHRRAETAWGVLNTHLAGRNYVVGDRLTLVDLSLCGYLFWPEEIGVDWNKPKPARLARAQSPRPWCRSLMPGHPRPQAA
jgi:glutathione S-transferase